MSTHPPRIARVVIAAAADRDERPWLVGDLDELHAARVAELGAARARAWYWSQVIRSLAPLLGRRLRRAPFAHSSRNPPMSPLGDSRPTDRLAALRYHLRHAFRRLVREPAFTAAAALTLALGVGANVAVFAVVEAVLLRPLDYPEPDRLVVLNHRDLRTGITKEFIAFGDYIDLAKRQTSFEAIAGYGSIQATIADGDEPFRVGALLTTSSLIDMLRLRPAVGRMLVADDSRPSAQPVMVLGHALWQAHFAGDPRVVGRSVKFNQQDVTIVGVAPPGFHFPPTAATEVIVPLTVPLAAPAGRKNQWTFALGRIKANHSLRDATGDLALISRQLEQEYPSSNRASTYFAVPLRDALVGSTKPALVLLLAAVGVVLLISCANVANLLLARSLSRRREMALRLALGAGRGRLAAQLLSESFALALVAGVAGVFIAQWGAKAVVRLVPQSVNVPGLADVHLNGAVLAFALGITVATTLAFGLVAMLTVRLDGAAVALVGGARQTASAVARRAASALVVVEVALAIVLLVGAGLIVRSFAGLLAVDPGFRADGVMTVGVALPADRYRDSVARDGFYRNAFTTLRALPGVEEVGTAVVIPLTGNNWTVPFERPEQPVPPGERAPDVGWQLASGGYFKALRIPLIAGRLFDERDQMTGPPIVIISEAIQKRFFPNEGAVGRQMKLGKRTAEIVGVVGNIRRAGLRDEPRQDLYFSAEQNPGQSITLFVRTSLDPAHSLPALQAALRRIESKTMFLDPEPLSGIASESLRTTKLVLWLLAVFATTALALAAVGIYGVMSYVVRQRTREIGTRIALGATRGDIMWLVLRQGATLAALGTVAGLVAGLAAARALASILYGVTPSDPATLAAASAVLVGTIMAACYVPAQRAATVDPARTLAEL